MMFQELAKKVGVKNIIVSHINNDYYKDNITVIVNEHFILHLVGKTVDFVPLDENGINKELTTKSTKLLINTIKKELQDKKI